jgi:heme/copper-type cytochrome/quinol oxidase subunit 3
VEHAARVEHPMNPFPGVSTVKFFMWLFLASEVMFFSGLIAAYIALRLGSATWEVASEVLNVPLTGLNTFILICSSVTMVKAFTSIDVGDAKEMRKWLVATAALGLTFVAIKLFEWWELSHHHIGPTTTENLFGATYFTLTGFHMTHVLVGVAILLYAAARSSLHNIYSRHNAEPIEILGLYWHFVDIVWIFLFTIVYLI